MKILRRLMPLSCKKAGYLTEKSESTSLSFIEKIQLRLHHYICDACNAYETQRQSTDQMLFNWFQSKPDKKTELPDHLKSKIFNDLDNEEKLNG